MANDGALGKQGYSDAEGEYNVMLFIIKQQLAKLNTTTLVKVVAVYNEGVAPVGTVDVQPLINQIDGGGTPVPHGVINNVPYLRIQGGINALIIDPQVGDIGMCSFASRDMSSVVASKTQSNPGSLRQFDWADALYMGGVLNGIPTNYVQVSNTGINIITPNEPMVQTCTTLTINAPSGTTVNTNGGCTINASSGMTINAASNCTINASGGCDINGNTTITGNLAVTGNIGAGGSISGTGAGGLSISGPSSLNGGTTTNTMTVT